MTSTTSFPPDYSYCMYSSVNFKNSRGVDVPLSSGKDGYRSCYRDAFLQVMSAGSKLCLGPASSVLPEEG